MLATVLFTARATAAETPDFTVCGAPDDPLVVRIHYGNREGLKAVAAGFDIWETHLDPGYVIVGTRCEEAERIAALGLPLEVETEKTLSARARLLGLPLFACYRSVEETYAVLDTLAAHYPNLTDSIVIGGSWDKTTAGGPAGYDLRVLKITNRRIPGPKPAFFLMAETHAREMATAETATRFAESLLQAYGTDPDVTFLLDYSELHLLPLANPDGRKKAEQGTWWRKNTDSDDGCLNSWYGVDLNRNHSFHWGGGGGQASPHPCDELYQGPGPASEPETLALQQYLLGVFPDRRGAADSDSAPDDTAGIFISLHAYGRLVLWPWSWSDLPPPNGPQLQAVGARLAAVNGYTAQQATELYPASGTADDWAYGELGVASFTFELGTDFFQDCTSFEKSIWPDNRQALLQAFKLSAAPYKSAYGPGILNPVLTPARVQSGSPVRLTAGVSSSLAGDQTIGGAEYFILPSLHPSPPGRPGSGHSLSFLAGPLNGSLATMEASLETTPLAPGRYLVVVRGRDVLGNWGPFSTAFLTVDGAFPLYFPLVGK